MVRYSCGLSSSRLIAIAYRLNIFEIKIWSSLFEIKNERTTQCIKRYKVHINHQIFGRIRSNYKMEI
jgi:hypothetical protein